MLYLANCTVTKNFYEDSRPVKSEVNHLVEADDESEVDRKVVAYYDKKEIEYCVYYQVNVNYCTELIR